MFTSNTTAFLSFFDLETASDKMVVLKFCFPRNAISRSNKSIHTRVHFLSWKLTYFKDLF